MTNINLHLGELEEKVNQLRLGLTYLIFKVDKDIIEMCWNFKAENQLKQKLSKR